MLSDPTLRSSLQHVSVYVCVCLCMRQNETDRERTSESEGWECTLVSLSVVQHSDAAVVGVCFRAS